MSHFPSKLLKTARTMYLYADGHAVIVHRKRDKDAGEVEWVTLHESIGVKVRFDTGRLIVDDASGLALVLAADAIDAEEASVDRGSDNTKSRGIAVVGSVSFNFGHGWTHFSTFPDLIFGDFSYQPDVSESWADVAEKHRWANYIVSKRQVFSASVAASERSHT